MKRNAKGLVSPALKKGVMALAAVSCLLPASAWADTVFAFSNLGTSGTITGSGSTEVATITVDHINLNGVTTTGNNFTETYTNSTGLLTFSGTGTGAFANLTATSGIGGSNTFLSIQEAAGLLGTLPLNAISIYSGVTSLTFSSAFLSDLGLTTAPTPSKVAGTVTLTAGSTGQVTSTVTTFDVAPEPSTFVMIGTSLLLAGAFSARGRFQRSRAGK